MTRHYLYPQNATISLQCYVNFWPKTYLFFFSSLPWNLTTHIAINISRFLNIREIRENMWWTVPYSPRRRSDQESWLYRCYLFLAVFCIFGWLGSCRILWIQKWWSNQTYLSIWFIRSNMWLIGQTGKQTKFTVLWLDKVSKGGSSSSWMLN